MTISGNQIRKPATVISTAELERLVVAREGPCISIYVPTHGEWDKDDIDRVRLKNAFNTAAEKLRNAGVSSDEARQLMKRAKSLELGGGALWHRQRGGLALFISPDIFRGYRLPYAVEEWTGVDSRFHLRPLLRLFSLNNRYYLLLLDQKRTRLLEATRFTLTEMPLDEAPTSLAESMRFVDAEKHLQFHSGAGKDKSKGPGVMYHGHGTAGDERVAKVRLHEFLNAVSSAVYHKLISERAPLIIVGQDTMRGVYRTVNKYPQLSDEDISVNPNDLDDRELLEKAWAIAEGLLARRKEQMRAAFEHLQATQTDKTSVSLEDIIPAALSKRIEVLFTPADAHVWGKFEPSGWEVAVHDEPHPGDTELLDLAVVHTLKNSGNVHIETSATLPGDGQAAAIFRY